MNTFMDYVMFVAGALLASSVVCIIVGIINVFADYDLGLSWVCTGFIMLTYSGGIGMLGTVINVFKNKST